jgi:hypothetical protein
MFARNIPDGWNKRKVAYIPNGHASAGRSRCRGGNWNRQEFSRDCEVSLVFSSGKPRVVTLYSSRNVEVLTPLHHSLYSFLKEKGWLLVGSPTCERLRHVRDGCHGAEWLSFDYESATDNIKIAYVRRAIEILIGKGEGLSSLEVDCLRVLSSLSLGGADAESGQPMGSPMSFPLLCLINKTVVDLALADLLTDGTIPFTEWVTHRCLINGDDLLTRSTSSGDLVAGIGVHGAEVGLKVNREKTMRSREYAEINSTVFHEGDGLIWEEKKTNVAALWMAEDVADVLGYAQEATVGKRAFLKVALNNVSRLARQKIKTYGWLDSFRWNAVVANRRLRQAVCSVPGSSVPSPPNLFPTEVVDHDLDLSREEVFEVITARVDQIRDRGSWAPVLREKTRARRLRKLVEAVPDPNPSRRKTERILRWKPPAVEGDRVLSILATAWKNKRKEELLAEDKGTPVPHPSGVTVFDGESCSPWVQIRSLLNGWKKVPRVPITSPPSGDG